MRKYRTSAKMLMPDEDVAHDLGIDTDKLDKFNKRVEAAIGKPAVNILSDYKLPGRCITSRDVTTFENKPMFWQCPSCKASIMEFIDSCPHCAAKKD